jgi:hypothetical protein
MLVVSVTSASTPVVGDARELGHVEQRPSTGVWSNLKSPVWTTVPAGVRIASANESGIEWATWIGSTVKWPMLERVVRAELVQRAMSSKRRSPSDPSASPSASRGP